ncbi:Zinc finger, RING-type, conserved site [Phaffia rhodozyma]|uniref:Zinc finger, RING-type, conserved site n=1 Tax=Phaffia rhodozyma TaxID=264483 RepID=A0A0F7SUG6_PHARH|nr:Zinc finger, RING-type, conserved site [Phaffia rhodozyma]
MNGGSDARIGSGRSSEETDPMASSMRNSLSNDRAFLSSTSLPYRRHAQTAANSGTSSSVNNSSSSKFRHTAGGNSQHRASSLTLTGRTLKRKPSLNIGSERDWEDDVHDVNILDGWSDSDRPTSNTPHASTPIIPSASTSDLSSRFKPKRAKLSTLPTDSPKSETESEGDGLNTNPSSYRSVSPSRSVQVRPQTKKLPRQQSSSPSEVQSGSIAQAITSSQDKGKGKALTDSSPIFEEDDWCCSICQDILVGASVLGACGHEYCGKCIWEYIKAGNTQCAICRVTMTEPKAVVLYKLNELIEKWAEKTLRGEEKKNWEIRKDEWLAYKFSFIDEEAATLASRNNRRAQQAYPLNDESTSYDNLYRNSYNFDNGMIRRYQDERSSDTTVSRGNPFSVRSHHAFPPLGPPVSQRLSTDTLNASSVSELALPVFQRIPRVDLSSSISSSSWSDRSSQRRPPSSGFISASDLHQPNTGTMPSRSYSSGSVWGVRPSAYTSTIRPRSSAAVYSWIGSTNSSSSSPATRQSQSSRLIQPGSMSAPARRSRSQAAPEVVDLTAD